jgi:hypothetical protein
MPILSEISATALVIGDLIIDGKSVIAVKKLAYCESHKKGIRRIHVNDTQCYDGVATLQVIRNGGN